MKQSVSFLYLCLFLCLTQQSFGQNNSQHLSVRLFAEVGSSPPRITLKWPAEPNAQTFTIFRKTKDSKSWGSSIKTVAGNFKTWTDSTISLDKTYEYRITKTSIPPAPNGIGYIHCGISVPQVDYRGSVLLLVDVRIMVGLEQEIRRWIKDTEHEGWAVIRENINTNEKPPEIRNKIKDLKNTHTDLRTVFILGHVAVPYSGDLNPDGHGEHQGAWPADCYYGELNSIWPDNTVDNSTIAARVENKNVPGDGKFDNTTIPSDIELEVGRVDFFNMPAFAKSETELLKQYLDKNHAFRTGKIKAVKRAIIQNNFESYAEGFSQTGWKSFSTCVYPDSVREGNFKNELNSKSYLLAYGAGGGTYTSAGGISTTQDFAKDSTQAIFAFIFGSYFGDWDSQNNFLRAALGSGTVLANAWAGRPNWQIHHMALGEPIGYSTRLTQNNSSTYVPGYGPRWVHIALMGDPTLVMWPYQGLKNFRLTDSLHSIYLNWEAGEKVDSYHLFRRKQGESKYILIAKDIKQTFFQDVCLEDSTGYEYMVRASRLETTPSGTFVNLSPGLSTNFTTSSQYAIQVKAEIEYKPNCAKVTLITSGGTPPYSIKITPSILNLECASPGDYIAEIVDLNGCKKIYPFTVKMQTSVGQINEDLITISPQPVRDFINLSSDVIILKTKISSLDGRTVIVHEHGSNTLFVGSLTPGRYVLHIYTHKGVSAHGFVKM